MDIQKTSPQLGLLREFDYSGTRVLAGISPLGEMIAIKPICENLGIDRKWQQDKIKNDPYLSSTGGMVKVIAEDGKQREMYCLPPAAFQEWLWNIPVSENLNLIVLEQYKKGLVIHLLMMLKVTLEEVSRLRNLEKDYQALRRDTLDLMKTQDEKEKLSARVKELGREYQNIQNRILNRVLTDPNQLSIIIN
jgi:hypothetical protein